MLLVLDGPLCRAGARSLAGDVTALVDGVTADIVVCDIGHLGGSDLATLDAVVRLGLAGRRLGLQCRLLRTPARLERLAQFLALVDVVPNAVDAGSDVEMIRKPEQRKQPLRVQECVDGDDAPALDVQGV